MQIDHSRGDRLVPETLLYGLYVLTGLQQMGGMRMAQRVSGKRRVLLSIYKSLFQTGTDEVRRDGGILAELLEDEILARIVLAVSLENEKCLRADRHNAVLAALALLDVHLLAVKIDVIPLEVACLKGTEAAVVDDRKQGLGIQAARAEQAHDRNHSIEAVP